MNTCIIGLGSNIQPKKNIREAKKILRKRFKIFGESRFVSTKPMGLEDQTDFMNGALLMATELDLQKLRIQLKKIEHDLGRPSGSLKYGPRTIDLDILVWNGRVVEDDFYTRDFIRESVLELFPDVKYSKGYSKDAI